MSKVIELKELDYLPAGLSVYLMYPENKVSFTVLDDSGGDQLAAKLTRPGAAFASGPKYRKDIVTKALAVDFVTLCDHEYELECYEDMKLIRFCRPRTLPSSWESFVDRYNIGFIADTKFVFAHCGGLITDLFERYPQVEKGTDLP